METERERTYHDSDGNEVSLDVLCMREPAWAASRLREADRALSAAHLKLAEAERREAAISDVIDEFHGCAPTLAGSVEMAVNTLRLRCHAALARLSASEGDLREGRAWAALVDRTLRGAYAYLFPEDGTTNDDPSRNLHVWGLLTEIGPAPRALASSPGGKGEGE